MKDEIINSLETMYMTNARGKMHLQKNCGYIRGKEVIEKEIDAYPPNHIEFCEQCVRYYENWVEGSRLKDSENQCERCGKKGVVLEYCESCHEEIVRKV